MFTLQSGEYGKVPEIHNKNIGTGENGNRQLLSAILQNIWFLDKIFQYFF